MVRSGSHGFSASMGTQAPHAGPCNSLCVQSLTLYIFNSVVHKILFDYVKFHFSILMPIPILSELVCYKSRRNGIGQFLSAGTLGRGVLDTHCCIRIAFSTCSDRTAGYDLLGFRFPCDRTMCQKFGFWICSRAIL